MFSQNVGKINLILLLTFVFLFASLAIAQTEKPQTTAQKKIGVIFIDAFSDEKTGIKDLIEAEEKLQNEFKSQAEELKTMSMKIQNLEKEIEKLQNPGEIQITKEFIDKKINEYELLTCKYKSKSADVKSSFDLRETQIIGEVRKKIGAALKQFAKERGYEMIIDGTKLETSFFTGITDNQNITTEFIKFYNENFSNTKSQ